MSRGWILAAAALAAGCADPCEQLVELVCNERPNLELCARYRERVDEGRISEAMCTSVADAYRVQLEQRAAGAR